MQVGHLRKHRVDIVTLQQLGVIAVEQLEAIVFQHIHAVVVIVGITAEVCIQLLHALRNAVVAQADLRCAGLQSDGSIQPL